MIEDYNFSSEMLLCLCDEQVLPLNGELITTSSLLPNICEDIIDAPSLNCLKDYFTTDAWMTVVQKGILTCIAIMHSANNIISY